MIHFFNHVKKFRIYSPIFFNASDVTTWNLTCEIIRLKLPCVWRLFDRVMDPHPDPLSSGKLDPDPH
jgi:hypothetical protein